MQERCPQSRVVCFLVLGLTVCRWGVHTQGSWVPMSFCVPAIKFTLGKTIKENSGAEMGVVAGLQLRGRFGQEEVWPPVGDWFLVPMVARGCLALHTGSL